MEAREIYIVGQRLRCQVCDHGRFVEREAQLNTAAASLLGFDWANTRADCYVCERCGFVHWFLPTRAVVADGDSDLARELATLRQDLDALGEMADETPDGVLST